MTWKLNNRTTLTTEFEYQRYRHTFDSGLPSSDQNFLSQPVNRFYGEPFNKVVNNQNSLTLNLTHQFNDNWSLRTGLNAINSQSDTFFANFSGANATQVNRVSYITDEFSENYGSQNELYGRFSTGAVKHQLVAGVELARYVYTYTFDFDFGGWPVISRDNPVYGAKQPNRANYSPFFGDRSRSNTLGLYVLDQITLARVMTSLLFGITATDPLTYLGVAFLLNRNNQTWDGLSSVPAWRQTKVRPTCTNLLWSDLVLVALLACIVPARRAAKVDPMIAPRAEWPSHIPPPRKS